MIYTSYFAYIPRLPETMLKISIALFSSQWAKIDEHFFPLKPNEQLLKEAKCGTVTQEISKSRYYSEILSKLSATKVYNDLIETQNKRKKKDIALLCYEKPGEICHRRFVSQWLEKANNIQIPEFSMSENQLSLL